MTVTTQAQRDELRKMAAHYTDCALPIGPMARGILAILAERAALAATLADIERDGTAEHNAAADLRSKLAQERLRAETAEAALSRIFDLCSTHAIPVDVAADVASMARDLGHAMEELTRVEAERDVLSRKLDVAVAALEIAYVELSEAEDKFHVFHCNAPSAHPDKPHLSRLSDRMGEARRPVLEALTTIRACTTEAELDAAWDELPVEVCREIGAAALDEIRDAIKGRAA